MFEVLMTAKEIAARLGVSVRHVHGLREAGVIRYIKLGRSIRFDWGQVQADLRKRTVKKKEAA